MSVYDPIFDAYLDELRQAHEQVMQWWQALLKQASPSGDLDTAERVARPRWPAGPTSHPRIIAVYRKYYIQCEHLNEQRRAALDLPAPVPQSPDEGWGESQPEREGIIEPAHLLIDNLDSRAPDLFAFMEHLVFQPIGTNYEGEVA